MAKPKPFTTCEGPNAHPYLVRIDDHGTTFLNGDRNNEVGIVLRNASLWRHAAEAITANLNARLKREKRPAGRFGRGDTMIERIWWKEALVLTIGLAWLDHVTPDEPAIKDIDRVVRNWSGFSPEDRWQLATFSQANRARSTYEPEWRGWYAAIGHILVEG